MSDLFGRILNIQTGQEIEDRGIDERLTYKRGHRDARHAAPEISGSGQRGVCVKCHKLPSKDGHDGCLGHLPGNIMNACCGHGNDRQAYIQYFGDVDIRGEDAVAEQARLIRIRDGA